MNETLIVVFTGVVAGSTFIYTLITGWLAWETRKMRLAQTEPRVSIHLEPNHTGLTGYDLVIRNDGQGPAKGVRFKFEGDSSYFRESMVANAPPQVDQLPAIRDGLDYLEVGQTLRYTLGVVSPEEFERASKNPWKFVVEYRNFANRKRKDTYVLDFSQFKGGTFAKNWIEEISKSLTSIKSDLHRFTEGYARIQVVTQSKQESEVAREESQRKSDDAVTRDIEDLTDTTDQEHLT